MGMGMKPHMRFMVVVGVALLIIVLIQWAFGVDTDNFQILDQEFVTVEPRPFSVTSFPLVINDVITRKTVPAENYLPPFMELNETVPPR